MKTKQDMFSLSGFLGIAGLFCGLVLVPSVVQAADGAKVFKDQKCGLCHSVPALKITKKMVKIEAPSFPLKAPKIDAANLRDYLTGKPVNGKKHGKKVKIGEKGLKEGEYTALVNWIKQPK